MDIWELETKVSVRKRVAAWNTSIAKWLRLTLFEPLVHFKVSKNVAQFITNMFSAFWHGVFPSYYAMFFFANLLISIEKQVFLKNIPYFPSFLYYFYIDTLMIIFKSFTITELKKVFINLKMFYILLGLLYLYVMLKPS